MKYRILLGYLTPEGRQALLPVWEGEDYEELRRVCRTLAYLGVDKQQWLRVENEEGESLGEALLPAASWFEGPVRKPF